MGKTINLTLPKGWADLTQEQLRYLLQTMVEVQTANRNRGYRSMEDYSAQSMAQVATLCLLKWSGLKVVCAYGDGWLVAHEGEEFRLTTAQIAAAADTLGWAKELPGEPVRLERADGATAVAADLSEDFSFDNWLSCEALWQVYQLNSDEAMLRQMAEILYHKEGIRLDAAETLGIFYWWASVKTMVSEMFPNFFKPTGEGGEPPSADGIRRSMDAQIRALTKGDITKEAEILAMGAMRALTELDAQAREYDELNKKYPAK